MHDVIQQTHGQVRPAADMFDSPLVGPQGRSQAIGMDPAERFVSGLAAGIARAANGNKAVCRVAVCSLFSRVSACRQFKENLY